MLLVTVFHQSMDFLHAPSLNLYLDISVIYFFLHLLINLFARISPHLSEKIAVTTSAGTITDVGGLELL